MELHSPAAAKKLWSILRIALFMTRKGLASKRRLMLDVNLMMKRGKVLGKSLSSLVTLNHHRHRSSSLRADGAREYEFSCGNSPNPIFFHVSSKRKHSYFPCINAVDDVEDGVHRAHAEAIVLPRIEPSPQCAYNVSSELAPGERFSPMPLSPFAVRISNFSSVEEGDGLRCEVDDRAEEFIKMFYQQLQAQNRIAVD